MIARLERFVARAALQEAERIAVPRGGVEVLSHRVMIEGGESRP